MCNVCAALYSMREGLEYDDKKGNLYYILGVGEDAEGKPAKFQIRKDGDLWQDKWIKTDDLANVMADLGADIHAEDRVDDNWNYFDKCLKQLQITN